MKSNINTCQIFADNFIQEHDIQQIAQFEDLQIYKSSVANYQKYSKTFNSLFTIEYDQTIQLDMPKNNVQEKGTWFFNRIVNTELNGPIQFNQSVQSENNVTVFGIDTGIDITHPQFEGRAEFGANFSDDEEETDLHGHGTHTASSMVSKSFGISKNAKIIAVKVLNSQGSGSNSGVIRGMEYVYNQHLNKKDKRKTIINMSLGGGKSSILDQVVEKIAQTQDLFIVVASGNENQNSCNVSPARSEGAITVMASDKTDSRAWFSNWGTCSDIYSPGVDILGALPNGKTGVFSGTSMSSPLTVGVAVELLNKNSSIQFNKDLKSVLYSTSVKDAIEQNKKATNNYLVHLTQN